MADPGEIARLSAYVNTRVQIADLGVYTAVGGLFVGAWGKVLSVDEYGRLKLRVDNYGPLSFLPHLLHLPAPAVSGTSRVVERLPDWLQ